MEPMNDCSSINQSDKIENKIKTVFDKALAYVTRLNTALVKMMWSGIRDQR